MNFLLNRRAAVLLLALAAAGPALAQRVPLEAFFQNPAFSAAKISPDGRHVAVGVASRTGRTQLAVVDTEKLTATSVAAPADADVARFEWVNDDRLVFNLSDRSAAQGDTIQGPGLFAVQRDGTDYRQLVDRVQPFNRRVASINMRMLDFFTTLERTTRLKNSDDVFVVQEQPDATNMGADSEQILRLNTVTGRTIRYARPAPGVQSWLVDHTDTPRIALTRDDNRFVMWYLDPATDKWGQVAESDLLAANLPEPLGFGTDGTFYVTARNGKDKAALYRFDLQKKALDPEPIMSIGDFDFQGRLVANEKGLLGIHYRGDAWGTVWFDAGMKEVQAQVDKLLPGAVNLIDVPVRGKRPVVLVQSFSDTDPGRFVLYDTAEKKLIEIGRAMPAIDPRQMAQMDLVRFKARDGLSVPAWLTLPKGKKKGDKLPMVVLVHGGPWVRGGDWQWEPSAQFLASRGYAVLEPEFRGSTGFGWQHFTKGFKQWGLAMQNDVADGTRWAIEQGFADPQRICIAGASYGGYATLMGLVNDPDLFRCGINWVGVTDIELMYSISWSDTSSVFRRYGMPKMVGDREKDAAQLRATSPIQQAARIKQPLLMAYGGSDRRVPIEHGQRFLEAVKKTNSDVEWINYPEEGHGWALVKNRLDFWSRVEKFLDRNIGAGAK